MNIVFATATRLAKRVILLVGCLQAICACGKDAIPVNIHGVNYEESAFSYVVSDPADKENRAGGELIEPFSAGGIMCCYMLPKKWRQGLKVSVKWTYWQTKRGSDDLIEVKNSDVLEIPAYPPGKPTELWVLRDGTGSLTLVGSNLQPDHPAWPGKIKGWPVPSLEYRRERWEIYLRLARGNVELYQHLLQRLHDSPGEAAQKSWETASEHMPSKLKGFSGYSDPKYLTYLEQRYRAALKASEVELEDVLRNRP